MRKKQLYVLLFLVIVTLGLGSLPPVSAAWSDWTSSAVGDVSENDLPTYWTITSTPKTGHEQYLWSDWHSVVDSGLDLYSNEDYEMRFTTYHQTNLMGYIKFMSKETIEDTEDIQVRGRFGVKYSYAQVKTVGSIQIYDITAQTVAWSKPITTSTDPNTYKWVSFNSGPQSLDKTHDYKIRLLGTDAWKYQRVEVVWESVEVWFYGPYDSTLEHGSHSWRVQWPYMVYLCNFESEFLFEAGPIDDMTRDHRPYVSSSGLPWGWDPCYLHEFRSVPYNTLEGDDWYLTDMPGSVGYTDSSDFEEWQDGFEEVEVYTRNPGSFESNTEYFVKIRYQVWATGSVTITLEAELGNEADLMAAASPPAMPVPWLVLRDTEVSHNQATHLIWGFESNTGFLDNETALLFLQLVMRKLKKGGRCGMVVPDGVLSSEGVSERIREELVEKFNLHAIVRLPEGVFAPYTDIPSNLIFFRRDPSLGKDVWYYQLRVPSSRKKYTKTMPLNYDDLRECIDIWDSKEETKNSWVVTYNEIKKQKYILDRRNPNDEYAYESRKPSTFIDNTLQGISSLKTSLEHLSADLLTVKDIIDEAEFRVLRITSFAKEIRRVVNIELDSSYIFLGVRSSCKGLFKKGQKEGSEISATRAFRVRRGDFIYSRLFARNGSFAVAQEEHDGCCVSSEFPIFEIDTSLVLPDYLWFFFSLPAVWSYVERKCQGTTKASRFRFKQKYFLEMEIPIPSIHLQERILAISEAMNAIGHAEEKITKDHVGLVMSFLASIFKSHIESSFK